MLDQRLAPGLSAPLRPLLWLMKLRTKQQRGVVLMRTLVGVPQGDPPSPHLFNIFMVIFLAQVNTIPRQGVSSLFFDDVLLLVRSCAEMQLLMNTATSWSDRNLMN